MTPLLYLISFFFLTSIYTAEMTLEEKVGQLFMIPVAPHLGEAHLEEVENLINKYHIGGIITKALTPEDQSFIAVRFPNMLISIDAEWGVNMRMKGCIPLPRNLTLGALPKSKIYEIGKEMGRQVRSVGAHINLGPVVDVNTNPKNPVIGSRSFGDNAMKVTLYTNELLCGMQEEGIAPALKHYPGHGDVAVDPHYGLPSSLATINELKTSHLLPFYLVANRENVCVMSAHILFPNIDGEVATFSHQLITDTLREEIGFKGVIMTDALNMAALKLNFNPQEIAFKAFDAGHDILLYGSHIAMNIESILRDQVPKGYESILRAVQEGIISEERLDQSVRRILAMKRELIKPHYPELINTPNLEALAKSSFEQAATLVGENPQLGEKTVLLLYAGTAPKGWVYPLVELAEAPSQLDQYDVVVVAFSTQDREACVKFNALDHPNKVALLLTSPYLLSYIEARSAIVLYENNRFTQELISDVLKGGLIYRGSLPINKL